MARIAVFDIDGVVFKSPTRESVSDVDYWERFWENPSTHQVNEEVLDIMDSLVKNNVYILLLTARPDKFEAYTRESLETHCGIRPFTCYDPKLNIFSIVGHPYQIQMRDMDEDFGDWEGSAKWKRNIIDQLKIHNEVLFAVEDFKPNAEEMRKSVPVLLYEQLRSSTGG